MNHQGPLPALAPARMDRQAYRAWALEQPRRYELLDGRPSEMSPERRSHAIVKLNVAVALRAAVKLAGLECEVFGDGFTVEAGLDTDFEPDATVDWTKLPNSALAAGNPVIVVEVLSPSTRSIDTGLKFTRYFQTSSIRHYLVIEAERRVVTHHQRERDRITSEIVTSGSITCDPPGLSITLDDIYEGMVDP